MALHGRVPTHATGKPLDPREIVLKTAKSWRRRAHPSIASHRVDGEIKIRANGLFERITAEEIWSCTSCKACMKFARSTSRSSTRSSICAATSPMESNFPPNWCYRAMEPRKPMGNEPREAGDWANDIDGVEVSTLAHRSQPNISTGSDALDRS